MANMTTRWTYFLARMYVPSKVVFFSQMSLQTEAYRVWKIICTDPGR
jgi:hypothetical protein